MLCVVRKRYLLIRSRSIHTPVTSCYSMSIEQRTTAPQATLTTTEYFRLLFSPLVANISTNTNNELSSHQKSMTFISFLQTKCIPTVSDLYNIALPKSNKMKVHITSQPMAKDDNTVPLLR